MARPNRRLKEVSLLFVDGQRIVCFRRQGEPHDTFAQYIPHRNSVSWPMLFKAVENLPTTPWGYDVRLYTDGWTITL